MAIRNNTFILKRSNVVNKFPALSGLTLGELALNTADVKLYSLYTGGLTGATEVREIGWNRLSVSGGTLYGNLNVLGSISATTYYGNGSNLTGINDYYVIGGTYSSGILTLNRQNGSVTVTGLLSAGSFGLSLSNGSNTITTGQKGYVKIPYPGTITSWTIMTNSIGSITVDVWKDVEANFPPTSADTITNGNYAYLSNQLINSDSVLSGWTTNFLAGDIFAFNVLSATSVTNINLTINVTKT